MQSRNLTLDLLKIALALMVIGLHGDFLLNVSHQWNTLTVNGLFRTAVPIFFIINGYYFTSISTVEKLKQWISRVLILYATWMLFYAFFWVKPNFLSPIELLKMIKTILVGYHHLWYLSAMIGAGILTFILKNRFKQGMIVAVICFLVGVLIQYMGNYHMVNHGVVDQIFNTYYVHRNFLFVGFPFFYIGYVISNKPLFLDTERTTLTVLLVVGLALLLGESWYNASHPLNEDGFDNYLSLILICPVVFLLAVKSKLITQNRNLALISTAIYLIHPFWLTILTEFTRLQETLIVLMCILLSVSSSFLIIRMRKKLSFIL